MLERPFFAITGRFGRGKGFCGDGLRNGWFFLDTTRETTYNKTASVCAEEPKSQGREWLGLPENRRFVSGGDPFCRMQQGVVFRAKGAERQEAHEGAQRKMGKGIVFIPAVPDVS
ncbi:MAG TPA: hypothetical protein H9679_03185 [Firmicutes bacterium]|nr:hypothetical protein [Bacillota bacterium]